jgi:histidinol-phosphatase (PHP family)
MADPWRISLHGGHSGEFCEHAEGTLRAVVEAAVTAGMATVGLSEHAPRSEDRFLYPSERQKGFTVGRLQSDFDAYVAEAKALAQEFSDRVEILVGFEAEVVPAASYADQMLALKEKYALEYMVGSVHYVGEIQIDGTLEEFHAAVAASGGIESLAVRYYDTVADMAARLKPEVVGHLDLIRRNAPVGADLQTAAIAAAADRALQSVKESGAILDLNTAGWRKGLGNPYPEPRLVRQAQELGIAFCFGDDSHGPTQVGDGIDRARDYLLGLGVTSIRSWRRKPDGIVSTAVPLS